ncbi:hypothetical protein NPIL_673451, partial [Nephila pilipes]
SVAHIKFWRKYCFDVYPELRLNNHRSSAIFKLILPASASRDKSST